YGWTMPRGLMDSQCRNPTNFSLAEWQQAKRLKEDPKILKSLFQDCWAVSDSRKAFSQALEEHGFYLARGDRRGFVAVDYQGEVFSLTRWLVVKTKALKARLGDPASFPGIDEVKTQISRKMTNQLKNYIKEVQTLLEERKKPLTRRKQVFKKQHRDQRMILKARQEERWRRESIERSRRLPKGLKAIWHRITGKYRQIREQNEIETARCRRRDRDEKHSLITGQLKQRQSLQKGICQAHRDNKLEILNLRQDIARYLEMGGKSQQIFQEKLEQTQHPKSRSLRKDADQGYEPEM
ncbi:MAG: relaxase, partial [Nitrospinales bacterium]